jgi:hypothetical protein
VFDDLQVIDYLFDAFHFRRKRSISQPTPMVILLTIIPKKTVQLKSFAIAESSLDSDVIALNIFNDTLTN